MTRQMAFIAVSGEPMTYQKFGESASREGVWWGDVQEQHDPGLTEFSGVRLLYRRKHPLLDAQHPHSELFRKQTCRNLGYFSLPAMLLVLQRPLTGESVIS